MNTRRDGIWTSLVAGLLLAGSFATSSDAATLEWAGTLTVALAGTAPVVVTETGVATVNGSSGLGHLNTLRFGGGFATSTTLPLTDPAVPSTLISVQVIEQLAPATLAPFSGGPPLTQNTLPMVGTANLCVLFPGCSLVVPIPLTVSGTRGIGIGGSITATTPFGAVITLQGAPWTLGVASILTTSGTVTSAGFVHGPASVTSSTAQVGGVVQIVTPSVINSTVGATLPVLSALKLHFIPEPGEMLLLGSALALLAALARGRMRD